jgi:quinol monooxygenase YgiN
VPSFVAGGEAGVITILFYMTVLPGKEREARDLALRLTTMTRAEDEGCLTYVFHQEQSNPRELVLYEQWRDQAALDAHLAHLVRLLGQPPAAGRLPAALLEVCEKTRAVRYDVLA